MLVPACAVWAGMWVVTGWVWGAEVVGAGALAAGVLAGVLARGAPRSGAARGRALRVLVAAVMLASCAVVGGERVLSLEHSPLAKGAQSRSVVDVWVDVQSSRASPSWGMAVVNAVCLRGVVAGDAMTMRQPVVLLVPSSFAQQWLEYAPGSVVDVTVRLGVSDVSDGTAAVLSPVSQSHLIRGPPLWQRVIESMRSGLSDAMGGNPPDQASLVPALVVGDVSAISTSMNDEFRVTGLLHLMAVSGANLAILLSFLSVLARRCGVRGRWLTLVSVIGVVVFIALCHSEPSVLRAAAMGVVTLMAVGRGSGSGIAAACLAVTGLCWIDPWMSRSVGFCLSVLACVGIIVWGRRWTAVLNRWLPLWAAEAMAIPLAAQVATQPVICWLSGSVSIAGLAANAAASPWVAPATVIGLVAAITSPVSATVASWAGYVAGWCAQPILSVAHHLAVLPGASHPWPTSVAGLVVVTLVCGVVAWLMPVVLSRLWTVATATAVMVAGMLVPPFQPGWPGQAWTVAACDVGQGDAVAVHSGGDQALVIDVGPEGGSVVGCLSRLGIHEIPVLVLTHFHADHAGALREVLDAFAVGSLLVPRGGGDDTDVRAQAQKRGIPVTVGFTGMTAQVGQVHVTVVSAWQSTGSASNGEESSAENNESLILRFDTPQMSLLDTGDVEVDGQRAALAYGDELKVDILKVPHHGSSRQDPDFLRATGATIALIGVGAGNPYGHPADKTVKELVNDGMEVVRTDEHGSMAIAHESSWSITTGK